MEPTLKIDFLITGNIPPEEITNRIQIIPTKTWLKGDSIQATRIVRKNNGWALTLEDEERTIDLETKVKSLLGLLLPRAMEIKKVCHDYNLESQISCAIYLYDETPIINFSWETINEIAKLHTTIDVDIILIAE